MSKMNTVKNSNSLNAIVNPTEGMVLFCEEENKHFIYKDGWQEIKGKSNELGLNMKLYDINAAAISQLPTIDDNACKVAIQTINKFHTNELNRHYMLLCKEQSYFTIFEANNITNNEFSTIGDAVITVCKELGNIKAVYSNSAGDFDIWVLPTDGDIWCLHLFAYDMGVIYFG